MLLHTSLYNWVRLSLCVAFLAALATVSYGATPAGATFPDSLRPFPRRAGAVRPPAALHGAPVAPTEALSGTPCADWTTLREATPLLMEAEVVHDAARERMIAVGGPEVGVWVHSLTGEPGWRALETEGPPGPGGPALYDPVRNRVLIFRTETTEIWELALSGTPTWRLLITMNTPVIPYAPGLGYDPVRDRVLMFGGTIYTEDDGEVILPSAWALSLASNAWSTLPPMPYPPAYGQRGYFDRARDRMVIVGGRNRESPHPTYTLTLTGTPVWSYLAEDSPGTMYSALLDSVRDRMLVYSAGGGLWELSLAAPAPGWTYLPYVGAAPTHSWGSVVAYDAPRDRMVLHGGTGVQDTWSLPLTGPLVWTHLEDPLQGPWLRAACAAIYDPPRRRMVVFGGEGWSHPAMSDVNAFDLSGAAAWSRLADQGAGPRGRADGSLVFDPLRDRMIVFGGREGSNSYLLDDAWSFSLSGPSGWTRLTPAGLDVPGKRSSHTAILDPVRDRMIVFGGYDQTLTYHNDVFALELAGGGEWRRLTPHGTPPTARVEHCAVYDPLRDRMLVIGGYDRETGFLSSVWSLSLDGAGQWSPVATIGSPAPTRDANAVYDPSGDRVLLFGGTSRSPEVYALDLVGPPTWSVVTTDTPQPARAGHAAIFDVENDRMVVFGGYTWGDGRYQNDVRAMGEATNTVSLIAAVEPAGSGAITRTPGQACFRTGTEVTLLAVPAVGQAFSHWSGDVSASENPVTIAMTGERRVTAHFVGHAVVTQVSPAGAGTVSRAPQQSTFAPGSNVTLTAMPAMGFGFIGWSGDASGSVNPLMLTVDRPLSITANFARYEVVVAAAPASGGSVSRSPNQTTYLPGTTVTLTALPKPGYAFAGWDGDVSGPLTPITVVVDGRKSAVANFEAIPATCGGWWQVAGTGPSARWLATTVWDPVRERILLFGGFGIGGFKNDLWEYSPITSTWTQLLPGGTPPGPRDAATAAYDAARDAVIVFGGNDGAYRNDAYLLSLAGGAPVWSPLVTTTPPAGRFSASLICDAPRGRLIFYGGLAPASETHPLWELDLTTDPPAWRSLDLPVAPPGRHGHAALFDAARNRMLVFGGTRPSPGLPFNDVWALNLAGSPAWTQLEPIGEAPPQRSQPVAALDNVRDRWIFFGGQNGQSFLDDTWALSLAHEPAWVNLTPYSGSQPPSVRSAAGSAFDPARGEIVVFGGYNPVQGALADTPRLKLAQAYALDLTVDTPGRGAVVRSPSRGCYYPNEPVTLTPVAAPEYAFTGWSGDASGTESPLTLRMDRYRSVVARFALVTTAALLAQFEAARGERGVELRWRFGTPERVRGVTVERAPAAAGPWAALALDVREEMGAFVAVDESAASGQEHHYRLIATLNDGGRATFGPVSARAGAPAAEANAITAVSPNPSFGATQIEFALARAGAVRVTVADVAGRRVTTLVDGELSAGPYAVAWDGTARGARVAPGMYFVRLVTPDRTVARRLVLVR